MLQSDELTKLNMGINEAEARVEGFTIWLRHIKEQKTAKKPTIFGDASDTEVFMHEISCSIYLPQR